MKHSLRHLMIGACALGLMACGDDNEGSGGLSIGTFPGQMAKVYCAKSFECCTAAEIADQGSFLATYSTQAECDSKLSTVFTLFFPTQFDVDAGKVTFNAAAAQNALDKAAGASCTQFFADDLLDDVGPSIYTGKVADGGECNTNAVCATPNADCTSDNGAPSVCVPPPAVGTACEFFFDCETDAGDLYCDDATMKCAAKANDGAACMRDEVCKSGSCFMDACGAKRAPGADCDSSDDCTSASCDFTTQKCGAPKADGEDCARDEECMSGACAQNNQGSTCGPATGPVCDGV